MTMRAIAPTLRYVISGAVGLAVAGLIVTLQGDSFTNFFSIVYNASFGSGDALLTWLRWSSPLILSALAFAIPFRAGVFNIGVEGQIIAGAFGAGVVGYQVSLPGWALLPLCVGAGILCGALSAWPAAWLYRRFGVNEIVTTLMLNYIILLFCNMLVREFFMATLPNGQPTQTIATPQVYSGAMFSRFIPTSDANTSILLSLAIAVIGAAVLLRSHFGYTLSAVGDSPRFAEFAGISVNRVRYWALIASGALGGLIGALEVQGVLGKYVDGAFTNFGFNGILVSLIGLNNPVGLIAAGLFMGSLEAGGLAISQYTDISSYLVTLITSLFILIFAVNPLRSVLARIRVRRHG